MIHTTCLLFAVIFGFHLVQSSGEVDAAIKLLWLVNQSVFTILDGIRLEWDPNMGCGNK